MKLRLSEWVRALKSELRIAAAARPKGPAGAPALTVSEIELEAVIETQHEKSAEGGVSVWVLEGKANSTRIEKRQSVVRIKLRPEGELKLGDDAADKL